MRGRSRTIAAALALLALGTAAPYIRAAVSGSAALPNEVCATKEARIFLDNPLEKIFVQAMSANKTEGGILVDAYGFGGLKYTTLLVTCGGEIRRL